MRAAFVKTLVELAARDLRIVLLTGDLGFAALEPFAEAYPARFFNVGVAEQNMVGLATGLAEAGLIPFVYSIVTFAALRPYEFIRNGPIAHCLPVRIVGMGGGLEYGHNGLSHHGLEDVGVMRIQPGITVIAPADAAQARTAIQATWNLAGPIYYRLGKNDQAVIRGLDGRFAVGRLEVIREGNDVLLLTMGAIAVEVVAAADMLAQQGIDCAVAVVASVQPPPDDLARMVGHFHIVLTVEAHYVSGGLGSLVAEVIAEHNLGCRLIRCGVRSSPDGITGSQDYLHHLHGISCSALIETVLKALP